MTALRNVRIVLWVLVAIGAAGAAYLFLVPRPGTITDAPEAFYARPFSLIDQDGETVTEASFLGRPSAYFYGFTHCPDVCPSAFSNELSKTNSWPVRHTWRWTGTTGCRMAGST